MVVSEIKSVRGTFLRTLGDSPSLHQAMCIVSEC
jgi:hypothetical protein